MGGTECRKSTSLIGIDFTRSRCWGEAREGRYLASRLGLRSMTTAKSQAQKHLNRLLAMEHIKNESVVRLGTKPGIPGRGKVLHE